MQFVLQGFRRRSSHAARVLWLGVLAAAWTVALPAVHADWEDDVGLVKLWDTLGADAPTGAGVFVSQVEAGGQTGNVYFPDEDHPQFVADNDPFDEPVTFINGSAAQHPNPEVSGHATSVVGRQFYGNTLGAAPGANTVVVYDASSYLTNFLNGTGSSAPDAPTFIDPADSQEKQYVVQNHSWIADTEEEDDAAFLRKFDFLIDTYDLTAAVGLNNGDVDEETGRQPHPPLPNLMGHSYNAIAVGRSDGLHSTENTKDFYGPGRIKPQLVTPLGTTSSSTAVVSGSATLLHEVVDGTDASKSEAMRAILLAGATKDEFANYIDPETGRFDRWERKTIKPLDNIFGAGELNVFNSYLMTLGGQYAGSTGFPTPVGSHGWDFSTSNPAAVTQYEFTIPEGSTAAELSIIVAWNADVASPFDSNPTLANLNMTLRDESSNVVDQSASSVDNVEHIYITDLAAGTYTLNVSSDAVADFGIAWRTETLFDVFSADFNGDGSINGLDFFAWQGGFGTLLNATHAMGDADGDGDVDDVDGAILASSFGTLPNVLPALAATIPEPGTALLAAAGLLSLGAFRRRLRR